MKTRILRSAAVAAMCAAAAFGATAQDFTHDFEYEGIYYDILSETEVAVADAPFEAPYSGDVVIPSQVSHDGSTYTVTEIGDYAFSGSGVTSVSMPNTVKTIDKYAFYLCYGLTNVEMSSQIEYIGYMAFGSCGITSIRLPNTLMSIGEEAFSKSQLESIEIPASVEVIGNMAFAHTVNMSVINVDAGNKKYCSIDGVLYDKAVTKLIACPAKKAEVEIPGTVIMIGDAAFAYCQNLKAVDMPESVVTIGEGAFEGCVSLTKMELPDNLKYINDAAFYGCSGLVSISFGKQLGSIGHETFWKCGNLTQVTIDEANALFTVIDNVVYAKHGTVAPDGMALVWCPGGLQSVTIPEGVVIISEDAFSYCEKLTLVTLPNTLQEINDYAFYSCYSLTEIAIPESVNHFGEGVFEDCVELQKVTFAENIKCKEIPEFMFNYCESLETIIVPDCCTAVGEGAFGMCESLTSVTIGKSVNFVGIQAFSNCLALRSVYCRPTVPPNVDWGNYVFDNAVFDQTTLYVPNGSKVYYEAAAEWKKFTNIVETDFAGVEDAVTDGKGVKVWAADGTIAVGGVADGTVVEVYGIGGGCVYRGTAGTISGLPAGIYVVRAAGQVTKVMLK